MKKHLVIIGNEYGFDIMNMSSLKFETEDDANETYDKYTEEYDYVLMLKLENDELKFVKSFDINLE